MNLKEYIAENKSKITEIITKENCTNTGMADAVATIYGNTECISCYDDVVAFKGSDISFLKKNDESYKSIRSIDYTILKKCEVALRDEQISSVIIK